MSILVTVNGAPGDGAFLIAPDNSSTFPARLGLRTDDGSTVGASLTVLPGGAAIELEQTEVAVGPAETFVSMHATSASSQRGDTVLQVVVNDAVQASSALTAVSNLKVWFKGRFQARFATDNAPYNDKRGLQGASEQATIVKQGWTFALEGEADFVPADSVPDSIDKPVGREIRFHDSVDPRSEVAPIGVTVTSVTGKLAGGTEEEFTAGDSVLGLPVNLGPSSYFAGNSPSSPGAARPAEGPYSPGHEPIALFEFHIGGQFSGKSQKPEDRPVTFPDRGFEALTAAQLARLGIPAYSTFNAQRASALQARLDAMTPADQAGTVEGRNLATRIGRLTKNVSFSRAWIGREWFTGVINDAIQVDPQDSATLRFLQGIASLWFSTVFFNFHSDELCGQVLGYIGSAEEEVVDPFEPATPKEFAFVPGSRTMDRSDPSAPVPDDVRDFL